MSLKKELEQFRKVNGWVKSPKELEMEKEGFRLYSNYDPSFAVCSRTQFLMDMYHFIDRHKNQGIEGDHRILWDEASDNLTCRIPGGSSYYIRAPTLIIPEIVVIRDLDTLKDMPYKGNVRVILKYAEDCRKSNETSLKEVDNFLDSFNRY